MSHKKLASSIVRNPWSHAVAGGALALIPGRKYPAWLRRTITLGSTATVVAVITVPRLGSKFLKHTSVQETPPVTNISPKAKAGFATVAGALMYGTMRLGWWFDEAAEQTMRKIQVPYPRVVLGVATGVLYYYTDDRRLKKDDQGRTKADV
ncbi:hypothetical protein [Arthrobacter sp. N1]|uniref:hypothetical protein n=1 Tax=Arthrobacter sp. N1 TaxID=619291 RepID=UPI003BB0D87C